MVYGWVWAATTRGCRWRLFLAVYLVLPVVLLAPTAGQASDTSSDPEVPSIRALIPYLGTTGIEELQQFHDWLAYRFNDGELPSLLDLTTRFLLDQSVPENLKRVILQALLATLELHALTPQRRERFRIDPRTGAITMHTEPRYHASWRQIDFNPSTSNLNQVVANGLDYDTMFKELDGLSLGFDVILTPDGGRIEEFLMLIHELAHVRFYVFMEKHHWALAERLPECFVRRFDRGTWHYNVDFINYLTERYAHQVEFETLSLDRSGHPVPWTSTPEADGRLALSSRWAPDLTLDNYRAAISSWVLREYAIDDPDVVALADRSLFQILRGDLGASPCGPR